jgi:hypothetical protein
MFYRLLLPTSPGQTALTRLPRVSEETRRLLAAEIDKKGSEGFTIEALAELEQNNPELLQMAHNFASRLRNYLHGMQGFALLYKSLVIQASVQRARLH